MQSSHSRDTRVAAAAHRGAPPSAGTRLAIRPRRPRRGLRVRDAATQAGELERQRTELKYFPILFISAPHIEDAISGIFPGVPTPLLFATSILARHLRIDEFPCARVPQVVEGPLWIDLDDLARVCATARAQGRAVRVLYAAQDFANPGGARMTMDCRRQLLDLADQDGLFVLEDNAYGFTAVADQARPPLRPLTPAGA